MTNYNYGFSGTQKPRPVRKSTNHGKGRICTEKGCDKTLSMYNDRKECFEHHKFKTARVRGRELIDIGDDNA